MADVEQLAREMALLRQELQQHLRVQQVEAENTRLRTDGLGALPQLVQALQQRGGNLPSLVDTKGIGKPTTFSGKEEEWREWPVKFESFVVGVYGDRRHAQRRFGGRPSRGHSEEDKSAPRGFAATHFQGSLRCAQERTSRSGSGGVAPPSAALRSLDLTAEESHAPCHPEPRKGQQHLLLRTLRSAV
eukprot:4682618-Amphidinium_carterae.2